MFTWSGGRSWSYISASMTNLFVNVVFSRHSEHCNVEDTVDLLLSLEQTIFFVFENPLLFVQ